MYEISESTSSDKYANFSLSYLSSKFEYFTVN